MEIVLYNTTEEFFFCLAHKAILFGSESMDSEFAGVLHHGQITDFGLK
jgi:hypothetical protein